MSCSNQVVEAAIALGTHQDSRKLWSRLVWGAQGANSGHVSTLKAVSLQTCSRNQRCEDGFATLFLRCPKIKGSPLDLTIFFLPPPPAPPEGRNRNVGAPPGCGRGTAPPRPRRTWRSSGPRAGPRGRTARRGGSRRRQ